MTDTIALVAFDLDDTLTPSKSPIPPEMGEALGDLLRVTQVCLISGGHLGQFTAQVLDRVELDDDQLAHLHLMPTCGTRYLRFGSDRWEEVYAHDLSAAERDAAVAAVESEARRLGLWAEEPWGEVIEDRGSQITFSALGQLAPLEAKRAWDPTGERKALLRDAVAARLPELEVRSGGSTSVDITRRGVDKAFGMRQLAEHTGIGLDEMLFIGDRLDEGGNDYPVKALGVRCVAVSGWEETPAVVRDLIAVISAA